MIILPKYVKVANELNSFVMNKVLIIEDDAMLAEMYATKFKTEGFAVVQAADGTEGIAVAKKEKPDVILLDVIMPKLDGFGTLQQLKADDSLKRIPVIMLTNLGQEEDIKKGKELGASDYFVKANQTPSQIVEKVQALLKH